MELRKCCNHPYLFDSAKEASSAAGAESREAELELLVGASGKMQLLHLLLPRLKTLGHKVLIFSQFKDMLSILERYLALVGYTSLRIDGNVPTEERQRRIDQFNDPDAGVFVFLLSTRAGGQGINLTAADTAVLFDSDFNPHRDLQALARCHRIGQSRKVLCLRLISKNTMEEKMIGIAKRKMALESIVVDNGRNHSAALSQEEMQEMLRHGASSIISTADHKQDLKSKEQPKSGGGGGGGDCAKEPDGANNASSCEASSGSRGGRVATREVEKLEIGRGGGSTDDYMSEAQLEKKKEEEESIVHALGASTTVAYDEAFLTRLLDRQVHRTCT